MHRFTFQRLGQAVGLILFALGVSGCFRVEGAALAPTNTSSGPTLTFTQTVDVAGTAMQQGTLGAQTQIAAIAFTQTAEAQQLTISAPTPIPTTPPPTVGQSPLPTPIPTIPLPTATLPPTLPLTLPPPTVVGPLPSATFTVTNVPTNTLVPPTNTLIPTNTPTLFPTDTLVPLIPAPTAIPTLEIATAALPGNAGPTSTLFVPTAVAQANTPLPDIGTQTQIARQQTATAFIAPITATAAANQTLIATSLGTGLPPNSLETPLATVGITPGLPGGVNIITATLPVSAGTPGNGAGGTLNGNGRYVVVDGDRLLRIAMRFGLTTETLARANGIVNPDLILPGQTLYIPGTQIRVVVTPIPPVPTNPGAPQGNVTIIVVTATPSGNASGQVYIVQEGDTLFGIAMRFRVRVTALAQFNNISDINLIYIGEKLMIP